jgi:hypothetical protein
MTQQNTIHSLREEKVREEVRAFFQQYPYCTIEPVNVPENYLVKKKCLMTKSELSGAVKDLMSYGELYQPKAGALAYNGAEYSEHVFSKGFKPFNVLKNGEPAVYPIVSEACYHDWRLSHQGDTFTLACSKCDALKKSWKCFPAVLSKFLDATARLREKQLEVSSSSKVMSAEVRTVVDSLYLEQVDSRGEVRSGAFSCSKRRAWQRANRHAWDTYAALCTILNVKSGRAPGNLFVRSKILKRLVKVYVHPDELKKMPRSSSKPYKFVVDVLKLLDIRLS